MTHINLNYFRFYLARHTSLVFESIGDTVAWVRRIETGLDDDIESLMSQLGPEELKARIAPENLAFREHGAAYLNNCRVGVSRYHRFQQWRAGQL